MDAQGALLGKCLLGFGRSHTGIILVLDVYLLPKNCTLLRLLPKKSKI